MSQADPKMLRDGSANLERGMDSGKAPNLLSRNQAAYLENVTVRGGFATTRPGFRQIKFRYYTTDLTETKIAYNALVDAFRAGKFQGGAFYDDGINRGALMAQVSGILYHLQFAGNEIVIADASVPNDPNPSIFARVYFEQADKYMVLQDSQNKPIIFDGANSRRSNLDEYEVPIGSGPMAYGNGRLWVAKGRTYVGGDLTNGPTGVLKFTENETIRTGGSFTLPLLAGNVTGMLFSAQADTTLGQGELLISSPNAIFTCNVPISRDEWATSQQPLQTIALQTSGSLSHWSNVLVNSDVFFRSKDGLRSLVYARRDFGTWGNVPISSEMNRVLDDEPQDLLRYTSAIIFDNRLLLTCLPQALPNNCYFQGITALDFDLISSLAERQQPCYDGLWTGLDVYHLVKGRFNNIERAFAFARSNLYNTIESIVILEDSPTFLGWEDIQVLIISQPGNPGIDATAHVTYGVNAIIGIDDGGTGHQVGDIIIGGNGTGHIAVCTQPATYRVTTIDPGGIITGLEIVQTGYYTANTGEDMFMAYSNGTGIGFRIHIRWNVSSVVVDNPGHGYTQAPIVRIMYGDPEAYVVAIMQPELELWEITKADKFDYPLDIDGNPVETNITSIWETAAFPFLNTKKSLSDATSNATLAKELRKSRLHVDEVTGQVTFTLQYKPDQNPCWQNWYTWSICAEHCGKPCSFTEAILGTPDGSPLGDESGAILLIDTTPDCQPVYYVEQYRPRMMVGMPPLASDPSSGQPANVAREFQARLQWVGHCRVKLLELMAFDMQEEVNPPIMKTETTCRKVTCTC